MLLRLGPEKAFETIGLAKTSTSAPDARRLRYLRDVDGWTMNRDRLVFDAKQLALKRAQQGYRPPARPLDIPVGGDAIRRPFYAPTTPVPTPWPRNGTRL